MTQADVRRPDLITVGLSAATAGIVLSSLLSPFELVKVDGTAPHGAPGSSHSTPACSSQCIAPSLAITWWNAVAEHGHAVMTGRSA